MYENLLLDILDGVAILTVNREKSLNAINSQTMAELGQFFRADALTISGLKGVIVTGAGPKAFVAGADIKEFLGLSAAAGEQLSQHGHDVFDAIEAFSRPVIAVVNGFALGAGCELAMACHLRIAEEHARFGLPEVNLGLIPGYGGTQRMARYVGRAKALELMMTTDMILAAQALQLGLVNHVMPSGEGMAKATEIIEKIATKAPLAIAAAIACVNAYDEKNTNGFKVEVSQFGHLTGSDDFTEGATAFVEKRKATFHGK